MIRMKSLSLIFASAVALCIPSFVLSCSDRCGPFGWFALQHSGNAGTANCSEYCISSLLLAGLKCGGCAASNPAPAPSPIAVEVPTFRFFAQQMKKAPVAAPIKAPIPVKPPVPIPTAPRPTPVAPVPRPVAPVPPPTAPVPPPVSSGYSVYVDLVGVPTADKTYFDNAVSKWQSVIVGDLEDVSSAGMSGQEPGCVYNIVIDDIYVCAVFGSIDGAYNVLGYAGPTYVRSSNGLTISGNMKFDTADLTFMRNQGNFASVILHEIGHIIGIGTRWVEKGVTGKAKDKCPYQGPKANAEYKAISGCNVALTETDGSEGDGTYCAHWDEQCLGTEIMTGTIGGGISPLSRISIATCEDLGYTVSYLPADTFTRSNLGSGCTCNRRSLSEEEDGSVYSSRPHVRQLGLSDPATQRRKLSDEAYESAMSFGQGILASRKAKKPVASIADANDKNDRPIYVGDTAVVVFVYDNGGLFDVVVSAD